MSNEERLEVVYDILPDFPRTLKGDLMAWGSKHVTGLRYVQAREHNSHIDLAVCWRDPGTHTPEIEHLYSLVVDGLGYAIVKADDPEKKRSHGLELSGLLSTLKGSGGAISLID